MIFNTIYNITYSHADTIDLQANIQNALNAVNNSLSMFNPNSTIARVNSNDTSVVLDPLFLRVFDKAQEISRITDGAFDITVAPLVNLWGFGLNNRETVDTASVLETMKVIGFNNVKINNNKVVKLDPNIKLDASAIAKGYACDVVVDTLLKYGCQSICVEIGGELTVVGKNPHGEKWRIGINKPIMDTLLTTNEIQEIVHLSSGGMATSGNYRNFYVNENGNKVSHTINPKTGFPIEQSILSATIIAKDCITADALATACMVMGTEKSIATIESLDSIHAYIIYSDNKEVKTWKTENFPSK